MSSASNLPCPRCGSIVGRDLSHCGSCGTPQTRDDPPEAWVGRVVDAKYAIERILGVGGMGMVFAARRILVGDTVALKVLFPRFLESPLQRTLFHDEAVAAARLAHRNVVTVFDAELEADGGTAYIAMEMLEGRTLKALLRERAPLPLDELLPLAVEICHGLAAAHAAGVVHRDLKPDNIFLQRRRDGSTRVKLVDFGIAAMLDADHRDEHRRLLGTLRYMAPEQCRGEAVDPRADLYALGVILYEALTRRRATGKSISAVLNDEVRPPNMILPEDHQMPHPLEDLIMELLTKRPEDRPPSAVAVRERLEVLSAPEGAPAPVEPAEGAGPGRGILLAALGVVAAVVAWMLSGL